jgi:hypothetical protein
VFIHLTKKPSVIAEKCSGSEKNSSSSDEREFSGIKNSSCGAEKHSSSVEKTFCSAENLSFHVKIW